GPRRWARRGLQAGAGRRRDPRWAWAGEEEGTAEPQPLQGPARPPTGRRLPELPRTAEDRRRTVRNRRTPAARARRPQEPVAAPPPSAECPGAGVGSREQGAREPSRPRVAAARP